MWGSPFWGKPCHGHFGPITVTGLTIVNVGEDLTFAPSCCWLLVESHRRLGAMAITNLPAGFVQEERDCVVASTGAGPSRIRVGGVGSTLPLDPDHAAWMVGLGTVLLFSYAFAHASRERSGASVVSLQSAPTATPARPLGDS